MGTERYFSRQISREFFNMVRNLFSSLFAFENLWKENVIFLRFYLLAKIFIS